MLIIVKITGLSLTWLSEIYLRLRQILFVKDVSKVEKRHDRGQKWPNLVIEGYFRRQTKSIFSFVDKNSELSATK